MPHSPASTRLLALVIAAVLLVVIALNLEFIMTGALAVVFVVWTFIVRRRNEAARLLSGRLLITMALLSTVEYLGVRLGSVDLGGWWIGIPLLLVEVLAVFQSLGFNLSHWRRRQTPAAADSGTVSLPIVILIPTLNEGADIVRATVVGAQQAQTRYQTLHPDVPVSIVVCNDGFVGGYADWRDIEVLATTLGVRCITRTTPGGAKAGNLEHARRLVMLPGSGDYLLVVLDADQIVEPDFLVRTVAYFADERMGWVQTGQYYRNLDSAVPRWAELQMRLFYDAICPPKSQSNAAFLCGTNFVLRAAALDGVGGFPTDTVTEDFAASILMHAQGWRSLYLTERLSTGLGPVDFKSYFGQQHRWATGTLGVTRRQWRLMLTGRDRRTGGVLSLEQRVQYLLSGTYYLCGLRDVVFVLAPLIFLYLGVPAVNAGLELVPVFFMYWLLNTVTLMFFADSRAPLGYTILEFACVHRFVEAGARAFLGIRTPFRVTSKRRSVRFNLLQLRWHVVITLLLVGGVVVGTQTYTDTSVFVLNAFWVGYRLFILAGVFMIGLISDIE